MEESLTAHLLGDTALVALVETRVHWGERPPVVQGRPHVTLQVVSGVPRAHYAGDSGLTDWLVQADVWGLTYAQVVAVARALRARLHVFDGPVTTGTFRGVRIGGQRDLPERLPEGQMLHRRSIDFIITHKEG